MRGTSACYGNMNEINYGNMDYIIIIITGAVAHERRPISQPPPIQARASFTFSFRVEEN